MHSNGEPSRPLRAHCLFQTTGDRALEGAISRHLPARIVELPRGAQPIAVTGNRARLQRSDLWYCHYSAPIVLRFDDGDNIRLQLPCHGVATTRIGARHVPVTMSQACVSPSGAELEFGANFGQLVWVVPRQVLAEKLAVLTGRPVGAGFQFDPALDLTTASGAVLRQVVHCLARAIDTDDGPCPRILLGELEQALMAALLVAGHDQGRALVESQKPEAAPWQVRRAEAYIEAHWDQPLTIEDLAAASGTSVRSLFRGFRQSRGCSPGEFARRVRLDKARGMLMRPRDGTTVTDVAMACGFGDVASFSKAFARTFGVPPSALLQRGKARDGRTPDAGGPAAPQFARTFT